MARREEHTKRVIAVALSTDEENIFMGSLVYRTGLELTLMEKLEKAGKTRYIDIVPFLRSEHQQPTFYTPKSTCSFVDDAKVADVVVCILQAGAADSDIAKVMHASQTKKAVEKGTSLIVAIDGMHKSIWNDDLLRRVSTVARNTLTEAYDYAQPATFVPISSTNGENLLSASAKPTRFFEQLCPYTMVQAIDL